MTPQTSGLTYCVCSDSRDAGLDSPPRLIENGPAKLSSPTGNSNVNGQTSNDLKVEESLLCNFQETISRARGIAMDAHVDWQKTVPESFRRNGKHFSKRIRRLLRIGQIILLIRFLQPPQNLAESHPSRQVLRTPKNEHV